MHYIHLMVQLLTPISISSKRLSQVNLQVKKLFLLVLSSGNKSLDLLPKIHRNLELEMILEIIWSNALFCIEKRSNKMLFCIKEVKQFA